MAIAAAEKESKVASVVRIGGNSGRNAAGVLLVFELARIDADGIVESLKKAAGHGLKPHRGSLAGDQALPIHVELVPLCLTAKDRMVFKDEAGLLRARSPFCGALVEERRRKTANAAADDHAIIGFVGLLDRR